jgi:hypothetical protein
LELPNDGNGTSIGVGADDSGIRGVDAASPEPDADAMEARRSRTELREDSS